MTYHFIMRDLSSVCLYNCRTKNKTFISYMLLPSIVNGTMAVIKPFKETVIICAYSIEERRHRL